MSTDNVVDIVEDGEVESLGSESGSEERESYLGKRKRDAALSKERCAKMMAMISPFQEPRYQLPVDKPVRRPAIDTVPSAADVLSFAKAVEEEKAYRRDNTIEVAERIVCQFNKDVRMRMRDMYTNSLRVGEKKKLTFQYSPGNLDYMHNELTKPVMDSVRQQLESRGYDVRLEIYKRKSKYVEKTTYKVTVNVPLSTPDSE